MSNITEGVLNVILYPSVTDKTKSRGFAFVEYESHRAAAMARRKLIPGRIQLWNHDIAVDWAEPEPDIDEETMSKVCIMLNCSSCQVIAEDFQKSQAESIYRRIIYIMNAFFRLRFCTCEI